MKELDMQNDDVVDAAEPDDNHYPKCDGCGRTDGWHRTDTGLVTCEHCDYRSRAVTRRRAAEALNR